MTSFPVPVLGDPLKSIRISGRIARILLMVWVPSGIIIAAVPSQLGDYPADDDTRSVLFPVLSAQMLLLTATATAFITWLYLSARLAVAWAPPGDYWSPGWAIGVWFIPIAWLVLVPLVVASTVRAAEAGTLSKKGSNRVWNWWVILVLAGLCWNLRYGTRGSAFGVDPLIDVVMYAAAAVLAIMLISHLTKTLEVRQKDLEWQRG